MVGGFFFDSKLLVEIMPDFCALITHTRNGSYQSRGFESHCIHGGWMRDPNHQWICGEHRIIRGFQVSTIQGDAGFLASTASPLNPIVPFIFFPFGDRQLRCKVQVPPCCSQPRFGLQRMRGREM